MQVLIRLRRWLVRQLREPRIEILCQCGVSVVLIDAPTCRDITFKDITFQCACRTKFNFDLKYEGPMRREVSLVSYPDADRMLRANEGWALAREEDHNEDIGTVYLERWV